MNISKQLLTIIARASHRNLSHEPRVSARYHKLKANQKRFQIDDGNPTYLKKGTLDKVIFNATVISCFYGAAMSIQTLIELVIK